MATFRYTWAQYQTVDRDGSIYEHELKPKRGATTWHSRGSMAQIGQLNATTRFPDGEALVDGWENMCFTRCAFPSDLPVSA